MKITEHDWSQSGGVTYEVTFDRAAILVIHEPSGRWWVTDYRGRVYDPLDYTQAIELCKASEASFGYFGVEDVQLYLSYQAAERVYLAPRYYRTILEDDDLPQRMADMQAALAHMRRDCECGSGYTHHNHLAVVYATVRELLSLPATVRYDLFKGIIG